jgi:epoxyqueuosine reductase QueG
MESARDAGWRFNAAGFSRGEAMTEADLFGELTTILREAVAAYPDRTHCRNWWLEPLLATAMADERFDALPQIAADDHLLPKDLLSTAKSLVVFFVPFKPEPVTGNIGGPWATRDWAQAYTDTNQMLGEMSRVLAATLEDKGYESAVLPATKNFDPGKLMAPWSHKHIAHLAGLGRFGHNRQIITSQGCAGRLNSFVTEAPFSDHGLTDLDEHCLHKAGRECLVCVAKCPVQALTESEFIRKRCWDRLLINTRKWPDLDRAHVCGKCVADLPCTHAIPVV